MPPAQMLHLLFPGTEKFTNKNTSKIKRLGVKNFPILSTSLFGVNASHPAIRKNTSEYNTIQSFNDTFSGRYGATAISKGTDAARGIPSPGPMET